MCGIVALAPPHGRADWDLNQDFSPFTAPHTSLHPTPCRPIGPERAVKYLFNTLAEAAPFYPREVEAPLHSRLSGVAIECLDWAEFITRYDGAGTLFYLDPPYWGCETDYGKEMFSRADFGRMAAVLRGVKGRFILSINDVQEIRKLFDWAQLAEVTTSYTVGSKTDRAPMRAELLISNFAVG